MRNSEPVEIYSVRLPLSVRDQLEELAKAQDRKPADVIRRLIKRAYADLQQRQQAQPAC